MEFADLGRAAVELKSMAATTSRLMTVAEFSNLPDDDGPFYHELRNGEVVAVPRPKIKHQIIQERVRESLKSIAPPGSYVATEVPYRALREHELRVADVAYVSAERWSQCDQDDYLHGAPDLVFEVLSPSNTAIEMYEKERLCLENGAKEFWVIDPDRRQVKVSTPDGTTRTWKLGQEIPLPLFGENTLAVDAVFA